MTNAKDAILLVARIFLSIMFIVAGFGKFVDPAGTAGMIAGAGIPAATALTYLAGLFELAAGLAILVGFQTQIAAILLALFCVFTALVFHSGTIAVPGWNEDALGLINMFNGLIMQKNLTLAGGFLALAAAGAGAYSIDARRR
jgi:putative oxidoreductase